MSHSMSVEEIRKQQKVYITVFAVLGVMTAVTVAVAFIPMPIGIAVVVAMLIALFKGSLVAGYFMHLKHEAKIIYATLILSAVFFIALMALPALVDGSKVTVPPLYSITPVERGAAESHGGTHAATDEHSESDTHDAAGEYDEP